MKKKEMPFDKYVMRMLKCIAKRLAKLPPNRGDPYDYTHYLSMCIFIKDGNIVIHTQGMVHDNCRYELEDENAKE